MKKSNAAIKVTTQSVDGNNVYECGDRFIIGKSGSADLPIDMDFVSRRHLFICQENDSIQLVDLNSANGTYVNQKRLEPNTPYQYKKGDLIYLGNKKLVIKLDKMDGSSSSGTHNSPPPTNVRKVNFDQTAPTQIASNLNDPDLDFLNDDVPSGMEEGNNTMTMLHEIQEQKLQLMRAENERKIQAEYQQKMLEANEKGLLFVNQAKQNAQRIILEAKAKSKQIIDSAHEQTKIIQQETNKKINEMNREIQSFEKETKVRAERRAEEIIHKAEEKANSLMEKMTASLEKMHQERNYEIQKAEERISDLKKIVYDLDNQKKEKEAQFKKILSDTNTSKEQLEHTDLMLEKYKLQLKDLERECKKLSEDKEALSKDHDRKKYDFDQYIKSEEAKLREEHHKIRNDVDRLASEKQSLLESVENLSNKKSNFESDVKILQEIKSKEEIARSEKRQELDKLQNTIEDLTQKKFELIKETDKSLVSVREDAIKNRNEALKLLESAKIREEEVNKKVVEQENRFKILITDIKNREEKAVVELNRLYGEIEKAKLNATNLATDILNNAKNESKKISSNTQAELLKKAREADEYYNKRKAEADNFLNTAHQELKKINEAIELKRRETKESSEQLINNARIQAENQASRIVEENKKQADELLQNAKDQSKNIVSQASEKARSLLENAEKNFKERMSKIEMDVVAKMAFEEEESKKRVEEHLNKEEALKAKRVKEVYRNIKDLIIGRLNNNVGKTLSSQTITHIQDDLQNVIKTAFGYRVNEKETIKGILFSGNLSRKVKLFWLKVALSIVIPITLLTIHLSSPEFFPSIGKKIMTTIITEETASDIFIKQMLEARKNKPKFIPPLSTNYKASYTDNILYTEGFVDTVSEERFQKEWVIGLNHFIVNDLNLSENAIVSFITKETRLIYELFEIRTKIKPENSQREIQKMRELEMLYETELISILGKKKENYRKVALFRKEFYEKFITSKQLPN